MIHLGEVRNFNLLRSGIVSVGVPTEKARLAVTIEPDTLTVARENGRNLQIQSHFKVCVEGEGYRRTSQLLFEERRTGQ